MFMAMPQIWLIVDETTKIQKRHTYSTPVYKTSERRGMLSTTGASTNFVMMIDIPMIGKNTENDWIKAGVAMLCSLDD